MVIREKLCFVCLRAGHMVKECNSKFTCTVTVKGEKCGRRHSALLHQPSK